MGGQDRLKKLVSNISIDKFPNVVLLVGEEGCGKHTFVEEIIKPILNLDSKDITNNLSYEGIGDIYLSPIPYIYIIDFTKLKNKKLDFILKFLEDSPYNSYIFLLSTNIQDIIPTILGRCQVWKFDSYSEKELENFVSGDNLKYIKYFNTPGKLLTISNYNDIDKIYTLCYNILTKYKNATLSNLIMISNRLDWDNKDTSKLNVSIFYDFLARISVDLFKSSTINGLQYKLINNFLNKPHNKRLFEKFLVELKSYGY